MNRKQIRPLAQARPILASCLMLLGATAMAQGVFRSVGADGRVTYSDRPPVEDSRARPLGNTTASASPLAQLPYELRQVVTRYPVTLYTSADCVPCNSGRLMLNARGIPYAEKTITTPEDSQALRRLSGEGALPLLTVGGQQLKGYSDTEWSQYLDAAGYPRNSVLPGNYRRPAASPMVEITASDATPPEPAPAAAPVPQEEPVVPAPANPAGIRF